MHKRDIIFFLLIIRLAATLHAVDVQRRHYDLTGERAAEKQYYIMETQVNNLAVNGDLSHRDIFRLYLVADPTQEPQQPLYHCAKMAIQFGGGALKNVPALAGWSYQPSDSPTGMDEKGQVFGIPHDQFANIADSDGQVLDQEHAYMVYNAFIDFHAFCDVFARPVEGGHGVQDLTQIGDKIIHAAAYTEPPVHLGNIKEGSTFKNGEVTLHFKGLSLVDEKECALLAYDSGASSFHMIMEPMPSMTVDTRGSSHYFGDIYLDLNSFWVQHVDMVEFVVSESTIASMNIKINGIVERQLTVRNVDVGTFEAEL